MIKRDNIHDIVNRLIEFRQKKDSTIEQYIDYTTTLTKLIIFLNSEMKSVINMISKLKVENLDYKKNTQDVINAHVNLMKYYEDLRITLIRLSLTTEDRITPYRIKEISLKRAINQFNYLTKNYPFKLEWKGYYPEIKHINTANEIAETQNEIRKIAKDIVLELGSSPFHLILSKFLPNENLMIITATQTDKIHLDQSEIPCVRCLPDNKTVFYYGDKEQWPSSETLTIWTLFKKLHQIIDYEREQVIIHAHTPNTTENYAWNHRGLKVPGYYFPLINWQHFGVYELGVDIAEAIISNKTKGVILDDHGPFIIEDNLTKGFNLLKKIEELAS